jgi:hypothetical protein
MSPYNTTHCYCNLRRVWRYQTDNQNSLIEEGQTIQWPKEKGQTTITKPYT